MMICRPFFVFALMSMSPFGIALAGEYNLTIEQKVISVDGASANVLTVNGEVPGPALHLHEGEEVTISVTNKLDTASSVHWHGLVLPPEMDGVPGLNGFVGIAPQATFTYRFKVQQSGTYWYHSHSGTQEQAGVYGAIVIDPVVPDPVQTARDYVILLSDFTFESGEEILRNLKNDSDFYNWNHRTLGDFFSDLWNAGIRATLSDRADWGLMRMDPTDLSDVSGYRFLINGKSPGANWTGLFTPGERIRLRFINASSMSYFDVRIPGLRMIVVQADGQAIEPVPVDEFRIASAETFDVIVSPKEDRAYTIFAEPIDRSGYARATLAPRIGMTADIPAVRPRTLLSMADMGSMHDAPQSAQGGPAPHVMQHGHMESPEVKPTSGKPRGWADASTPEGMRALKYADLRSFTPNADTREPGREIVVHLGGSMNRYIWSINGSGPDHTAPINLRYGERVKLTFVNDTMMAHPMHLHGMFVQLINGQPSDRLPSKHVVSVAPGTSYSVLLTADAPGEWAFHCHLLYHMLSGMMTKVVVARLLPDAPR